MTDRTTPSENIGSDIKNGQPRLPQGEKAAELGRKWSWLWFKPSKYINTSHNTRNPIKVTLLGTEGTGKTCFFGGLAVQGFNMDDPAITIEAQDNDTANYLNSLERSLQSGKWPPPTNVTSILSFLVNQADVDKQMEILTLDYPGEDFRNAVNQMTLDQIQRFNTHLIQSDVIILLVDSADIEKANNKERKQKIHDKLRADLAAVRTVAAQHSTGTKAKIKQVDLCIGITKCDMIPELLQRIHSSKAVSLKAIEHYFYEHLGNYDKILRQVTKIKDIRYFALSAVGQTQQDSQNHAVPIADHIEPSGYIPMFRWITERSQRIVHRQRRYARGITKWIVIAVFIVHAIFLVYNQKTQHSYVTTLNDLNRSTVERLRQTQPKALISDTIISKRLEVVDAELDQLKKVIHESEDKTTLLETRDTLNALRDVIPEPRKVDLDKLFAEINKKLVVSDFQRVKDAHENNRFDFLDLSTEFLGNHPTTSQAKIVREMIESYRTGEIQNARSKIKIFTVSGRKDLVEKTNVFEIS